MVMPLWLKKSERIKLGAFYTPPFLVSKVRELVSAYKDKAVLLDPAGGCGAFIEQFQDWDYRVADIDKRALECLRSRFDPERVFYADALRDIRRSKYGISEDDFLVIVGNPPYNDWTSLYKKGQKGSFVMDRDVFDRDLGISFLKAMSKLRADVVCVIHPMSYLIKPANFRRLRDFFKSYSLKRAFVFPSYVFSWTSGYFPLVIALYERDLVRFSWDDLMEFGFEFLDRSCVFRLRDLQTTDGLVQKYPRKGQSSIGLYFLTFRDINSLLRNRDFLFKEGHNTIPVEWENFSLYAYLVALKHYILERGSKRFWFYGNFSPLIDKAGFSGLENAFVHYALRKSKVLPEDFKREAFERFPWQGGLEVVEEYFGRLFPYAERCEI